MSPRLAAAVAAPLAAGWGLHALVWRRRLEAARRDPLTGLLTRDSFEQRARKLLAGGPRGVLVMDLDGFKAVNDTHGHAAGDAILGATGRRLTEWNRVESGVVARLGGDEFAAVSCSYSLADLHWTLAGLSAALNEPIEFEGERLRIRASIGAAWSNARPGLDLSSALRRADEAMYIAKRGGGGWLTAAPDAHPLATVNGRRAGRSGTHRDETGRAA